MYESFYGLTSKPFQLNPDPNFYFGSKQHRRATAYLEYGLHQNEGFNVVTGEIGAGKTTIVRGLLNKLNSDKVVAAQLVSTQLDAEDTLRMVAAAFGVRNVSDLPLALSEMKRVTAAGGRVVILEITQPVGPVGRRFSAFWFDRCVPLLGGMIAGDLSAYSYLPASVRAFPSADRLAGLMVAAGLQRVRYSRFGMGMIALHVGQVPAERGADTVGTD